MRGAIKIIESLSFAQISNIIPVIEQGLELEKVEYLATKDPVLRTRIADTSVFLSLLYFRKLNVDRPGGQLFNDLP